MDDWELGSDFNSEGFHSDEDEEEEEERREEICHNALSKMISLNIAVPNEDLRVAVMSLGIADVQKELKFHPKTGRIIKFGPKLTTDDDLPPEIA